MEHDFTARFARQVFGAQVMKERLSENTLSALKSCVEDGTELSRATADAVATAMKDWAIEHGATHYCHWFQPMTGITAEKHVAFLAPDGAGGAIADFSYKELLKGDPDASSFPSGGLRATFEARGYTAWDPTSYAFIKDNTLCIPTAFCAYTGEVLDKKTPLLRSADAVGKQARRMLNALGLKDVKHVTANAGAEQEYFLLDRELYLRRPDLRFTGRTLFGARPSRSQELSDQYSGALRTRVSRYMRDLDEELWQLGIFAQTEHNETAPAQHELASIYADVNTACDHNQLIMELMKKVAEKHGFVCLLHEKPFAGVNGSGKHNNWSLSTDTGLNLMDAGSDPKHNLPFLLTTAAVIRAVDLHQDLLRISTATAGNDERLGGSEAPPAILSVFLGEELTDLITENESTGGDEYMQFGTGAIPPLQRDNADRNRTSPFAFTGNKFEFRMPGSSLSVADPNIMINTAVADVLMEFADALETAEDPEGCARELIRKTIRENGRILFNGNNYAPEWVREAQQRGLLDLGSAAEAIPHLTDKQNICLFERHGIYTETELLSRRQIMLETYAKTIGIEAVTALDMVRREILPAVSRYTERLTAGALNKRQLKLSCSYEIETASFLSDACSRLAGTADRLERLCESMSRTGDVLKRARCCREEILPAIRTLREDADACELRTAAEYWPYPTYGEMLFSEE